MRFPGISLVEQPEQKIRRCESVSRRKTSDCNSRALLLIKAPTTNKINCPEMKISSDDARALRQWPPVGYFSFDDSNLFPPGPLSVGYYQ